MQMTQKILEAEGEGDPVQLDFFLKGNLALEKDPRRKPHTWLPDQVMLMPFVCSTNFSIICPVNCFGYILLTLCCQCCCLSSAVACACCFHANVLT